MKRNINSLTGYSLKAINGEIGEVKEFYFDDEYWTIRYLIVKTGSWLSGREVLLQPGAIVNVDWLNGLFNVSLTKEKISDSPDIDTHKPVYRQQEIDLYEHYAWEGYWLSGFYPGGYLGVSIPFPTTAGNDLASTESGDTAADGDLHLRSTEKVTGYHVHAKDGEIGHIVDFIIDDHTWQLLYFVVDTHNWFGGKKVLIPVDHIQKVEWDNSKVYVDLTMAAVKKCSVFEETVFNPWKSEDEIKVTLPEPRIEIH
jgi:sporulation protein YlmC with PRC-barrel domain